MSTEKEHEELYHLARKKLEERAFNIHFVVFIIFNTILIIIWRFTGISFPWFVFPLGIWSIFILLHFVMSTFYLTRRKPNAVLERAIEIEVWKMKEAERQKEAKMLEEKEKQKEGKTTGDNDKQEKSDTDKTS